MLPKKLTQLKYIEIHQLITLQKRELNESFINQFGDNFLYLFFKNVTQNLHNFLLVTKNQDKIIGFCIVCTNNQNFIKELLKKDSLKILAIVLKTLIKNPQLLPRIIYTLFLNKKISKTSIELLYLAVDKKYQRKGIGKGLIKMVNKILKKQGFKSYMLGTRADNKKTNSFYKHLGYKYLSTSDNFGSLFNYYYFDL